MTGNDPNLRFGVSFGKLIAVTAPSMVFTAGLGLGAEVVDTGLLPNPNLRGLFLRKKLARSTFLVVSILFVVGTFCFSVVTSLMISFISSFCTSSLTFTLAASV